MGDPLGIPQTVVRRIHGFCDPPTTSLFVDLEETLRADRKIGLKETTFQQ